MFVFQEVFWFLASTHMLFPPVFAANMAAIAKVDAESGVAEFEVLDASNGLDDDHTVAEAECEVDLAAIAKVDAESGVDYFHVLDSSKGLDAADKAEGEDEDDDCWSMPEVWTQVKALHAHPVANRSRVKMGSIAMKFIEAEGKGEKVPKKRSGRDASTETAALIEILFVSICTLSDRCTALEDALMRGTAASSSVAQDAQSAKKKKTVPASVAFLTLPKLNAWSP